MNYIKLTRSEYTDLSPKDPSTYYLIRNEGKVYLGETQIWKNFNTSADVLVRIEVTTPPTKTEYLLEDVILDTSGIVVTGTYLDGHTANITALCTITANNMINGELTSYSNTIIVSYLDKTITATSISVIGRYLTFTAQEANSTIKLTLVGTPSVTKNFSYSTNKIDWTDFSLSAAGDGPLITLANIGDKVYFRGTNNNLGEDYSIYNQFVMTGSINASGNVNTLLSYTENITDLTDRNYCFVKLFLGCIALASVPELPATILANHCYGFMFSDCTKLIALPGNLLPTTTLADYCYSGMFNQCTSLTNTPVLPAMSLKECCYDGMFYRCSSLTTAPLLPATTLASECYLWMFDGCTALVIPPALPATELATCCYREMFRECTSLTTAPALPATNLWSYCYWAMFYGCTSLVNISELPATNLNYKCYASMFSGCTSLVKVPLLPATKLEDDCYNYMFGNCTSLQVNDAPVAGVAEQAWTIPSSGKFTNTRSLGSMFGSQYTGKCAGTRASDNMAGASGQSYTYYTQNTPIGG